MASLSLAMVQGQKNAQDLARSKFNTLLSMANDTKAIDSTMDYFAAPNVAARAAALQEQDDLNNKVANLKANYKDINTNPEAAAARLLSDRYGQPMDIIRDAAGNYAARPKVMMPAGNPDLQSPAWQDAYARAAEAMKNTVPLGTNSPDQLASKVLQDYLYSPAKQAEAIIGRAAEQTKIDQEIRKENLKALGQETAKTIPGGHYQTQKDVANITGSYGLKGHQIDAGATLGAAATNARAAIEGKVIGKGYDAKEVLPDIKHQAALSLGGTVSYDATGKPSYKIPAKIDGKDTLVDLDMAPQEAVAKFNQTVAVGMDAFSLAPNSGQNPVVAASTAMRKTAAALSAPPVSATPGGLPTVTPYDPTKSPEAMQVRKQLEGAGIPEYAVKSALDSKFNVRSNPQPVDISTTLPGGYIYDPNSSY
jgi:hypothetical protein